MPEGTGLWRPFQEGIATSHLIAQAHGQQLRSHSPVSLSDVPKPKFDGLDKNKKSRVGLRWTLELEKSNHFHIQWNVWIQKPTQLTHKKPVHGPSVLFLLPGFMDVIWFFETDLAKALQL